MEKILLLNPPGKYQYLRDQYCSSSAKADYYWPAVDLLVLSGILAREFNVSVLDAIVENFDQQKTLNLIEQGRFKAIISLTSSASSAEDFSLFKRIKEKYGITIVANGGFLRYDTPQILKQYEFLDAVILDYTQDGILKFLKAQAMGPLAGLCYRRDSRIIEAGLSCKAPYFSYPVPRHDLFPLKKYFVPQAKNFPLTCILSTSGCNYRCRFCSSSNINFRPRDISNLIEEIKAVRNLGIKEIHFSDFTFTSDRRHCLQVCAAILRENLEISWDCLTRVDCFDDQLARIMKKAGCHTIQFGVESKNEGVLKSLRKPLDNETVKRAFSICRNQGIATIGFFIIGLPGEDEQSTNQTIAFARELDCDYASFSVFVPDFGTDIRKELQIRKPDLKNMFNFDRTKFPVIGNEFLSRDKIWRLRNKAIRNFYFRPDYFWKCLKRIKTFIAFKRGCRIFWSLLKMQIIHR